MSSGVPVLSAKNVKDGFFYRFEDLRYVNEELFHRWMPVKLASGDVVLTSEAPLGEVAYIVSDEPAVLGQRLFALRVNPSIADSRFLYYALQSPEGQHGLHARATGSTAQGIRQSELRKVEIDLPPLPEQEAIAEVLGALDDKIELNRKMNATLDELARTIFRSWFVDFDPVREKMEGREPFGMDAATAALFPDRLVDSTLGPSHCQHPPYP